MKTIIFFLSALMISFTSLAESQDTAQDSKSFETSISESKPDPKAYNKKKRAKQVKKMRARAAKSSKRSGGDLTNFNCGRR